MTFVIKPHENKRGIHPFNKGQLFVDSRSRPKATKNMWVSCVFALVGHQTHCHVFTAGKRSAENKILNCAMSVFCPLLKTNLCDLHLNNSASLWNKKTWDWSHTKAAQGYCQELLFQRGVLTRNNRRKTTHIFFFFPFKKCCLWSTQ